MKAVANKTEITVDLITEVTDIGQLASLAAKLGFCAAVEPNGNPDFPGHRVRFIRVTEQFLGEEVVNLAILHAYVRGISGDQVLQEVRSKLEHRHFPLDRPIQDVMVIGGGPDHDGHDH